VRQIAVSNDGRISLVEHSVIKHAVWDIVSRKELCSLEDDDPLNAAIFSPDKKLLAGIADYVPSLRVWSAQTGSLLWSDAGEDGDPPAPNVSFGYLKNSMAFSPDSQLLAISGAHGYRESTPEPLLDETSDSSEPHPGAVCVWELRSFQLLRLLSSRKSFPAVRFSDDGRQLIIEDEGKVLHYDCGTWELRECRRP
jgi:hypothetical protein